MHNQLDNIARFLNLPTVCIVTAVLLIGWAVIGVVKQEKMKRLSTILAVFTLIAILFVTVLSRLRIAAKTYPIPFSTFQRALENGDLYQFMVLNIVMFIPMGCSLVFLFNSTAVKRILMTILACFLLSCLIEILQFELSIGYADVDDIIVNTLGVAIGSLAYPMSLLIAKIIKKKEKSIP